MKKKVLVVEDDPSIRYGLVEVLTSEGFLSADCDRGEAPPAIGASWEFTSGCPATAAFMSSKVSPT